MSTIRLSLSILRQTLAVLALCIALGSVIRAQATYPPLEFQQIGERRWRIIPDYPNPPPLKIRLNDSTVLEYTIHNGYETNFRSGPKIVDIIAKQIGDNKLNLAWLGHELIMKDM